MQFRTGLRTRRDFFVVVIAALVGLYLTDFTGGWSIWIASAIAALTVGFFTYHYGEELITSIGNASRAFVLTIMFPFALLVIVGLMCMFLLPLPWDICQWGF